MGSKSRTKSVSRKRKFHSNQHQGPKSKKPKTEKLKKDEPSSSSAAKLKDQKQFEENVELSGYRFMDILLLQNFMQQFSCPHCEAKNIGSKMSEKRIGLHSTLSFSCSECGMDLCLPTSEKIHPNGNLFDVNRRFVMASLATGRDRMKSARFLANMNIPPPQSKKCWNIHTKRIHKATRRIAKINMSSAIKEARTLAEPESQDNDIVDITLSLDGSWQRRGFSSKNGVVTAITVAGLESKVAEVEIISNYCNTCVSNKQNRTDAEFREWQALHKANGECERNHNGSAGAMEPAGVETIYHRSLPDHNTQFTGYLGDGDSKSYSKVANADPPIYPTAGITKYECCGHIQKRMGKRLMNKVAELKNNVYPHNGRNIRGIGGAGKLTKVAIKKLQGHYGAAIRNNVGNIEGMQRDIWAIFNHRNRDHTACGDWCPSNSGRGDPNANAFPQFVCDAIRPVFTALSSNELLQKCVHGGTQNTNESFHNMIWERCPKTQFVGRTRLEIAVYDAAISYNGGELSRLPIFEVLNLSPGYWSIKGFSKIDNKRVDDGYIAGCRAVIQQRRNRALNRDQPDPENYDGGAHL